MKKVCYLIGIGCLGLGILSCGKQEKKAGHVISLEASIARPADALKASDYFSSVEYIPLETPDSALISSSPSFLLHKGRLYVLNSSGRCMVFDAQTGQFVRMIGNRDKGPQGYSGSQGAWIDPNRDEINFRDWNQAWIRFGLNGEFRGKQDIPAEVRGGCTATYLDKDNWVVYPTNFMGPLPFRLAYVDKAGEAVKTFPMVYRPDTLKLEAIQSISVFGGEQAEKRFGNTSEKGMVIVGQEPDREIVYISGQPVFWHFQGNTWFKESFCDTIYRLTADGMMADRVLDLGKYRLSPEDNSSVSARKEHTTVDQVTESDRFLLFSYWFKPEEDYKPYRGILDKETGKVETAGYNAGFKNDLNGFMDFYPSLQVWEESCAYLVTPLQIQAWFEENPEKSEALEPGIRQLKALKEDDNPVLVVMKMK